MRWRPHQQNTHYLSSLLRYLSSPKTLSETAHIHQQLTVHGRLSDSFLTTKLVQLYADADRLPLALQLFDALPQPNVFAWTAVLAALSRSAAPAAVISAYSRMRAAAVAPDSYVLPVVLRATNLPSALHADAVKFAAASNTHVANALIAAYSAAGHPSAARKVFDEMPRRDLLSWNSIVAAYATEGRMGPAMELVESMNECQPDAVTWNIVMDGFCRAGRCDEARAVFDSMSDRNVVSWTGMMVGYSRIGNHQAALELFRQMVSTSGAVSPDLDTLSCVISAARHVMYLHSGREIHAFGLKTLKTPPGSFYCFTGAALVVMYACCGCIRAAKQVFLMMDRTDPVTWNAMILGFVHSEMAVSAVKCFSEMQCFNIKSDETTVATVLPACDLNQGKQIHGHVVRHWYDSTTLVSNALIAFYSRWGCIMAARSVFSRLGIRDVVSWNTMIAACGSHGLGREAVGLVAEMTRAGSRPNSVTMTSALAACSHCGMVDEGIRLLEGSGLEPTMEQYACLVDLFGRAGRFEEAVQLIRRMPMMPDRSVWGALLAASGDGEGVEFGRMAFEELVRLEPENAGIYVTMSGVYARAGKWEEAKMVRRLMEERVVVKPYGFSWVEVVPT